MSVGLPLNVAATATSWTTTCPWTAYRDTLLLGEFAEKRNGPSSASQHGADCVPELVIVKTASLRTRLISFACAIDTYASFPRVTSPNGALTLAGMFDTNVA